MLQLPGRNIITIFCNFVLLQRGKSTARDFTLLYIEKEDCGGGPVITKAKVVELRRRMGVQ